MPRNVTHTTHEWDVTLRGSWHRPLTYGYERFDVKASLRNRGWAGVQIRATGPVTNDEFHHGARYGWVNDGTFEMTTVVEASTEALALRRARAKLQRDIRDLELCGVLTFTVE
jgi:hypothetical protein